MRERKGVIEILMEDWPTLPQLARELGVADSTARRWASSFPDLLPTKGHGSARRFHPQARDVLKRVQSLYTAGFNTDQVSELLQREFSATVDVVTVSETQAHERKDIVGLQSAITAIFEQQTEICEQMVKMEQRFIQEIAEIETHLENELVAVREENERLRNMLDERLESRDKVLMETLRALQEKTQQELAASQEQKKRRWWPFG
ncbi:MerR family transcriptional regulator [Alicyclobacillus tolerans]|uniref:MerR family transcriptional regulator n=1 Tax=Alicyclobacillus tolerans TaxID=90970 RepID=UPI003B7FC0D7